ncbi:hypothetical protein PVAP13_5NG166081 [Panicum virgatum]|jgi:hypothetical protein|uniref:Uncharacterized protein n=1 Tax=Panicum virgatum TaxID=38727 RepID=A0A8T0RN19_PANVG|nr:hypothetical protein PVAP13_5NG166081 [Panicum virgatum]
MWNPRKVANQRMGKPNQTPTPVASRDVPAVITNHLASASWSAGEGDLAGRKKKRREKETRGGERNGGGEGRRQRRVCGATPGPGVGLATGGAGWMSLETTRRSAAPRRPYGKREISCICARTSRDLSRCARREVGGGVRYVLFARGKTPHLLGIEKENLGAGGDW